MSDLSKAIRPLAGTILALTLFQGIAGWGLTQGADYGHKHTAYLLIVLAIALPVIVIKSEINDKSVKGNSFAVAGMAVIQLIVGMFLMVDNWKYGWIHIPLAMMLAAHSFAVLISMKYAQKP
jgi:isoprenylcysteine carboxyl methyltransferase (ICMT) family protein YpbQ